MNQQPNSTPFSGHTQRRCGLGLTLLSAALLSACGGGGDTASTEPSVSRVFAEPSGALCAQRDANNVCAEPTSSAATTAQLLAMQQNASGDRVRFNALGVQGDLHQEFASVASGLGVTQSQSSYALLEQPLLLGRNQVSEAATVYAYDSAPNTSSFKYRAGDDTLTLGLLWSAGTPLAIQRNDSYDKTGSSDGSGRIGNKDWAAFVGPLTDRVDAPAEADVSYVGTVTIRAGDGSPVKLSTGVGLLGHIVWGSCPITLNLRTSDGKLTTTDASCTDPQTQAVIRFSLSPLNFAASRVRGQVGSEAQVQIEGPSGGLVSIPGIERTSALFSSSSVSGAVYGKSAAGIAVVGVNANGMFQIVARRQ